MNTIPLCRIWKKEFLSSTLSEPSVMRSKNLIYNQYVYVVERVGGSITSVVR